MIEFKGMIVTNKLRDHTKRPLGRDTVELGGMMGTVTLTNPMSDIWYDLLVGNKRYKITIEEDI